MCGILGIFDCPEGMTQSQLRAKLIECAQRLRHRGPDWSGYQLFCQSSKDSELAAALGIGPLVIGRRGDAATPAMHAIAHERLAIVDPESGAQPLWAKEQKGHQLIEGEIVVAANGEIYNYRELYAELKDDGFEYEPRTGSDCEVIIPLYRKYGLEEACAKMRGMFSFVLFDRRTGYYGAARDHVGITSLYVGYGADGSVWFSSELKALARDCVTMEQFKPGYCWHSTTKDYAPWYKPLWRTRATLPETPADYGKLREAFEVAVERRMMSDVPWGVLLSGGLDSSLVASVAQRILHRYHEEGRSIHPTTTKAKAKEDHEQPKKTNKMLDAVVQGEIVHRSDSNTSLHGTTDRWMSRLHSFSVGLEGSPDLAAAAKAAEFIGTVHHPYTFTLQEGLDALKEVIYHLETYDVTTVRAATPMFLMSRKIKAMGVKMVLSGEGADEILAGYLYFHKAPNKRELHLELKDKIDQLFVYDCLRANKSTMAWGLEARVPFLDQDFLECAMNLDPAEKMIKVHQKDDRGHARIEKYVMRKAFDTPDDPYLPPSILWRQKEQFSDGVGYSWIDSLRDHADALVTDQQFAVAKHRFPYNTPRTKEAYYYRDIFDSLFPSQAAAETIPEGKSIACSTERALSWDASFTSRADQSGRSVGVHVAAYDEDFDADSDAKKAAAGGPKKHKDTAASSQSQSSPN
mmetsp:Transcript_31130/g.100298  ORF Transcript_31130/g.100298 Transcript_31130/m.100298 type:complete len:689 (-) Transcript_31130:254-2320(-)